MAYKAAQLSYLVDLGMRPDADDTAAENFARNLVDHELAEFERIGDADGDGSDPPEDKGTVQRSGTTNTPGPGTAGATTPADPGQDLTRSANGNQTPADLQAEIQRAIAANAAERRRRAEFIRQQAGTDIPADLVQRALAEDWDEQQVTREFLRALRTRPAAVPGGHGSGGQIGIISRSHDGDCTLEALQGAMLLREGFALDDAMFARREASAMLRRDGVRGAWLNNLAAATAGGRFIARVAGGTEPDPMERFERARDMSHNFASLSMVDFCREALRLANRPVPHDRDDVIRRALSTATLSAIFSTSVNMQILQAYLGIADSTRGWVTEADVNDFKVNDRGRLTKASGMKKLARGAEAQQIEYGDAIESYKIARYAGQFTIDEQDMIDDSFGGLSEHTPRELGELAAELRPNLVYAILFANANMRDATPLFHADHGNVETSAALAAGTLRTAKANMATQSENGRSIQNAMRYLIVPENLEFTARQLVTSAELRNTTANTQDGTANPHQGQFQVVPDPRLDNGVTDPDTGTKYAGSETTWYGAAAANRNGIEIGYRRGTGRAPRMDTFMLTGARWGMGWKCNMDIGGKAIDWRGLHRATA